MRTWMLWTAGMLLAFGASCAQGQEPDIPGLVEGGGGTTGGGGGGRGGSGGGGGTSSGGGGTSTGGGGASGGSGGSGGTPGGECATDAECASSSKGKICDKWKNVCVGCVTTPSDSCPSGQYCDYTQTCQPGCKTIADCGSGGGDGGTACASLKCDASTHQCTGCCSENDCPLGNICDTGQQKCVPGCTVTHGCDGTKTCCTGQCYDLSADKDRCGACDKKCALPNATPKCVNSVCDIDTCNTGFGDCNKDPKDGCEFDVSSDAKNCGACANDCSTKANVDAATCSASKCVVTTCKAGYGDCNKDGTDGCEATLATDPQNCNACGTVCPTPVNGTALCQGGVCSAQCNSGYADCNNTPADCEVNLNQDPSNCGACGKACSAPHSTPSCSFGQCRMACNNGWGDCNNSPADGCEGDLNNDPLHCGRCTGVCSTANGVASCSAGSCHITCDASHADCNGNSGDGCERDITTTNDCGACYKRCSASHADPACTNKSCTYTCQVGYADCNSNMSDGCETSITNNTNCGKCGNACNAAHASNSCNGGACAFTCSYGYTDCDKDPSNGCEIQTTTDLSNCGACGKVCSFANATPRCSTGNCAFTCLTGFKDCNGKSDDGCEVNTTNDNNNCGTCGRVCTLPKTCQNGSCI